jgi:alanine dehydrogenase
MAAAFVTAVRTAAASAVATTYLARPESESLAILGAGALGRAHVWSMKTVRPVRRVRVWSRQGRTAERFRRDVEASQGLPVDVCATAREAVEGVDIVCTTSLATSPIVEGAWLAPGTHVNAVGAHAPDAREIDGEAMAKARVVVDSIKAAETECGEIVLAVEEGLVSLRALVGELGELIDGTKQGRLDPSDITIYKSLGIAVQDVATASMVYRKALDRGLGTEIELAASEARHASTSGGGGWQ